MAYISVALVQSEFKSIEFSASSAISSAAVDTFIAQEEAIINSELSAVYSVPIASADNNAYNVAKMLATLSVKARIMDILPVKTGNADPDQGNPADDLRARVKDILDKIKKKEMFLDGATLLQSDGGTNSYNYSNDKEQVFQKDIDQW